MAQDATNYDLTLLLDLEATDDQIDRVLTDVQRIIEQAGEITADHDWGVRPLAFEINKRTQAAYRLVQFKSAPGSVAELERTLRIADGLVRHRIVKQPVGAPPAPEMTAAVVEGEPAPVVA